MVRGETTAITVDRHTRTVCCLANSLELFIELIPGSGAHCSGRLLLEWLNGEIGGQDSDSGGAQSPPRFDVGKLQPGVDVDSGTRSCLDLVLGSEAVRITL